MYEPPRFDEQPAQVREIIDLVRLSYPSVRWSRLQVSHPGADDDGIWFFSLPDQPGSVDIESTFGVCPFDVDTDKHRERFIGETVAQVAEKIVQWLALPTGRSTP